MGLWEYLKNREERRLQEDRYILCLDGGGMRGVIPATILGRIEQKMLSLGDDRPLYSHFDLVAGTSTGGLIALALTAPSGSGSLLPMRQVPVANQQESPKTRRSKTTSRIYPGPDMQSVVDIYLKYGKVIFPKNQSFLQLNVIGQLFNQKYDDNSFVGILSRIFGDLRMDEALVPTMVVTYDCTQDQPYIISSYERGDIPMREAAHATSAAPTYFSPVNIIEKSTGEHRTLIDGGVIANNPVLYAYMEAKKLFPSAKRFHVLSLSTASTPYHLSADSTGNGVIGWLDPTKGTPIYRVYASSQMRASNDIASSITDLEYVRIHGSIGKSVRLDDTDPKVLAGMVKEADRIYVENEPAITAFCLPLTQRPAFSVRKHDALAFSTSSEKNTSLPLPAKPGDSPTTVSSGTVGNQLEN
jgi:predicted acylesterase/phospholipase RssA